MPSRARLLFAAAISLAIVLVPALPATADTSDFEFESFRADYTLSRDADGHARLDVVETAVAVFPSFDQNRGIIRSIPDYYGDVFLDTAVLGVTDENGADVYYEVQHDGGFTILLLGDDSFVHGETTYVIHYTQTDTIRSFADRGDDEFYWDVNGTGWDQPFGEVGATVTLGPELAAAMSPGLSCYQGPESSSASCSEGINATPGPAGGTLVTAAARDLQPGENLTIVVPFAAGTFVEGTPDPNGSPYDPADPLDAFDAPPVWAIVLSLFGWLALATGIVAAVVLRRPRVTPTGTIIPQYSVPKDLDVMIAAELIGRRQTALQAQIVSLAVKRKIRLLGYPVQDANEADYAVQFVDGTGLESWEQAVVAALFGPDPKPGDARDLKRSGDSELAAALSPIVDALPGAVTASGFEGEPVATRGGGWFVLAAVVLTIIGIVGSIAAGFVGLVLGVGGTILGLVGVGIAVAGARKRPRPSAAGATWVDYLLGMRMYLELAEEDRFRMLQSASGADRIDTSDGRQIVKLYEKLLPWAVIWGIEDSWARELEIRLQQAGEQPDWYVGSTPFTSAVFLSTFSGVNAGINPPVSTSGSSWSGSGGSSFSGGSFGGGFSGGGGGGGGGGGR